MKRIFIQILILTLLTITNNSHAAGPFYNYPQTGQTTCYDTAGTVIACANTGQDGELQTGMPWPNPRFTDNGNGTVTDNLTGLIWLKNANCFGPQNWDAALTSAKGLATAACGLTDGSTSGQWRLPSIVELESLVDLSRSNPALPAGHPFSAVQSNYYWSSSTFDQGPSLAWFVYMPNGTLNFGDKPYGYSTMYGWPVRSGQ